MSDSCQTDELSMTDDLVGEEAPDALPSVAELKKEINKSDKDTRGRGEAFYDEFAIFSVKNERSYVHLRGLSAHYRHKGMWSYFIAFLMLLMIAFQSALLGMVGSGLWSFEKYTWLLPGLLVQNLAQVIGLAVFVVKALFKEIGSE